MKSRSWWIGWCVLVVLTSGCGLFSSTKLTHYYDSARWEEVQCSCDVLEVAAFSREKPPEPASPPKPLMEKLSPEGQQALIQAMGGKAKDIAELLSHLADKEKDSDALIDKTQFQRRVVFSVAKKNIQGCEEDNCLFQRVGKFFWPADRISELQVILSLDPPNSSARTTAGPPDERKAYIASWDRFETKEQSVDLGKLKRTHGYEGEVTATVEGIQIPGGPTAKIVPRFKTTEDITEDVDLKKRRITLSGRLTQNGREAVLRQEGALDTDLTGTFAVDFTLHLPHSEHTPYKFVKFGNLVAGKEFSQPGKVTVNIKPMMLPNLSGPLECYLGYEYVIRKVIGGHKKIAEGYHRVAYLRKKTGLNQLGKFTLIGNKDIQTPVFSLIAEGDLKNRVQIKSEIETIGDIHLETYEEAKEFLLWLRKMQKNSLGNYSLFLRGKALEPNVIDKLKIYIRKVP